jgi:hypothetical protein
MKFLDKISTNSTLAVQGARGKDKMLSGPLLACLLSETFSLDLIGDGR